MRRRRTALVFSSPDDLLWEEVGGVGLDQDSVERGVSHGLVDRLPVVPVADKGRESDHESRVSVQPHLALIPVSSEAVLEAIVNKYA